MKIKPHIILALVATHALAAAATYAVTMSRVTAHRLIIEDRPTTRFDDVLDGDTVVVDGVAIHIRGVDAPELGPWAKCWAEAIAARESMQNLESELRGHEYRIVDRVTDKDGKVSARFISQSRYDIADAMKVDSAGAAVDGKWDWCGTSVKLTGGADKPAAAPNLWWPSGDVYDPRAAD